MASSAKSCAVTVFTAMMAWYPSVLTADVVYTLFTHSSFVGKGPGPDGYFGTADDVDVAGFNPAGTMTYSFLDLAPLGTVTFPPDVIDYIDGEVTQGDYLPDGGGGLQTEQYAAALSGNPSTGNSHVITIAQDRTILLQVDELGRIGTAVYTVDTEIFDPQDQSLGVLQIDFRTAFYSIYNPAVWGPDADYTDDYPTPIANYLNYVKPLVAASNPNWSEIYFEFGLMDLTSDNTRGTFDPLPIGGNMFLSAIGYTNVPVPAAIWLLGSALAGMGVISRRRKLEEINEEGR